MKELSRVWIPYQDTNTRNGDILWYAEEETILKYIKSVVSKDPEKALRFSYGSTWDNYEHLRMVIPTETLKDFNLDLDLWGKCWEKKDDLLEHASQTVDWKSWGEIDGTPVRKSWRGQELKFWKGEEDEDGA
jgi:hypothetical protein